MSGHTVNVRSDDDQDAQAKIELAFQSPQLPSGVVQGPARNDIIIGGFLDSNN